MPVRKFLFPRLYHGPTAGANCRPRRRREPGDPAWPRCYHTAAMTFTGVRADPRYEVNARVDVGDEGADHKVRNISLGGIGIESANIQDVGTVVDLMIRFPDLGEAAITLKGNVVWVNREPPTDMGIRFLDLD